MAKSSPAPAEGHRFDEQVRETVESVVVAFLLAFLIRTFNAEAFVIPTGSMATTLMGRHKDARCQNCTFPYQVNASDEVDRQTGRISQDGGTSYSTCPNCYAVNQTRDPDTGQSLQSYNGDRIVVTKFDYMFREPERWDVIVFKYPETSQDNYIKRLVGLPNETIALRDGNVYAKPDEASEFEILRKPPSKVRAMLQLVHDNDYERLDPLVQKGWPRRWLSTNPAGDVDGNAKGPEDWTRQPSNEDVLTCDGSQGTAAWLRYLHQIPSDSQRDAVLVDGRNPASLNIKPQTVDDFVAYNSGRNWPGPNHAQSPSPWTRDLALECEVEFGAAQGAAILELVEGGTRFQCRLDMAAQQVVLSIADLADFKASAPVSFRANRSHQVLFANVDDQLTVWVDGSPLAFDQPTTYALNNDRPQPLDLAPCGVCADHVPLTVRHLKVWRDIYYTSEQARREYPLGPDDFFALGDNTQRSKDSRYWDEVPRELLVGRALLIFWPHSFDRTSRDGVFFPLFPNFNRMGFIR